MKSALCFCAFVMAILTASPPRANADVVGGSASGDFNADGATDSADLAIYMAAFDMNVNGDADNDGDTDPFDFLTWQANVGKSPGDPDTPPANFVQLSLNIIPNNPLAPNSGGQWSITAKTDSSWGISGIALTLSNVSFDSIQYGSDLQAILDGGNPFVMQAGSAVQLLYGQDNAAGPLALGVGTSSFVGNVAFDVFGDVEWNNSTIIATGAYSSMMPAFTTVGVHPTASANLLAGATLNLASVPAFPITVTPRIGQPVAVPEATAFLLVGLVASLGAASRWRRRRRDGRPWHPDGP